MIVEQIQAPTAVVFTVGAMFASVRLLWWLTKTVRADAADQEVRYKGRLDAQDQRIGTLEDELKVVREDLERCERREARYMRAFERAGIDVPPDP